MTTFKEGIIYSIIPPTLDKYYVGMTTQPIETRLNQHFTSYWGWKRGNKSKTAVYDIFDKYGPINCQIIPLKTIKFIDKIELYNAESEYIKEHQSEIINVRHKQTDNVYLDHRRRVKCICGAELSNRNLSKHMKTETHKEKMLHQSIC